MNTDYFRILSLDGASITGGMGWLSMGALRDKLHRNLELTKSGLTNFADPLQAFNKRLQLVIPPHGKPGTGTPQPIHPKGNLPANAFLKALHELAPGDTNADIEIQWLALWLRFRSQQAALHAKHPASLSPYLTELATMRLALDLYRGSAATRELIFNTLKKLIRLKSREWRSQSVDEYCPQEIPAIESVLSQQQLDSTLELLLNRPERFLLLRWLKGAELPPSINHLLGQARSFLYRCLHNDDLFNPVFGDLKHIDLLAGTSSGGLNTLVLAQHNNLNEGIHSALEMWRQLAGEKVTSHSHFHLTPRFIEAIAGQCSFLGKDGQSVIEQFFPPEKALNTLKHHVMVTATQLDSGEIGPTGKHYNPNLRRWKPVFFHNLPDHIRSSVRRPPRPHEKGTPTQLYTDIHFSGIHPLQAVHRKSVPKNRSKAQITVTSKKVRLIDVARHTSNIPIVSYVYKGPNLFSADHTIPHDPDSIHPSQSGFLDGGFYANNPSMAATSLAVSLGVDREKLAIISIGNGRQGQDYAELQTGDLGYEPWLLRRGRKALLLDIMLDLGIDTINAYCSSILGSSSSRNQTTAGRYLRNDAWTDCLFLQHLFSGQSDSTVEYRIDEALGYERYIREYPHNVFPYEFFSTYWQPRPPTSPAKKTRRTPAKKQNQKTKSNPAHRKK